MTCRTGLLSLATAFALAALGTASANAQEWPTRSVKFLVPYGPGGGTDIVSRIIAQQLQEKLGQSFVVENKPGAGSTHRRRHGREVREGRFHRAGAEQRPCGRRRALQEAAL